MKRLIAALGLTAFALSASALEVKAPYEQLNVDRALPNLSGRNVQYAQSAAAGRTLTDATLVNGKTTQAESPWANDYNFIVPAQ
jgi:hypothetical protein